MLRVDVRLLREGSVPTEGSLGPDDPVFADLDATLAEPVRVGGMLQAAGRETYYWHGRIAGVLRGECRRCLTEVLTPFESTVRVVFSADPATADDPGVYPLGHPVTVVDVTTAVREEVGLAAPMLPLCREACAGLCPRCGEDLNQGPCACQAARDAH